MARDGEPGARRRSAGGASSGVLRAAMICGLLGGLAWIATYVVSPSSTAMNLLHWGGGVLITIALVVIGMLMVKSDVMLLRLFVAAALPVLVWGVFAILRQSRTDDGLLDAAFGVVVGLGSALVLARRSRAASATL